MDALQHGDVPYCGKPVLTGISVRLKDNVDNEAAISAISQLLTRRHGIKDFQLYNFEQIRKVYRTHLNDLQYFNFYGRMYLTNDQQYRGDEHHVDFCNGTNSWNWRTNGGWRETQRHYATVYYWGRIGLPDWWRTGIALSYITGALFNALADGIFRSYIFVAGCCCCIFCSTLISVFPVSPSPQGKDGPGYFTGQRIIYENFIIVDFMPYHRTLFRLQTCWKVTIALPKWTIPSTDQRAMWTEIHPVWLGRI